MGKRLSRIVTRTGDDGQTGLADGSRVEKSSARLEAIGAVDELNSQLGVFLSHLGAEEFPALFEGFQRIQNELFDLGGELSMPGHKLLSSRAWEEVERRIEELNEPLPPLTNFILPGGSLVVAQCHVVRAVARRAERRYVALCMACEAAGEENGVNENSRIYLNRLSDLFFVSARWIARARGEPEVLWQQQKPD